MTCAKVSLEHSKFKAVLKADNVIFEDRLVRRGCRTQAFGHLGDITRLYSPYRAVDLIE